MGKRKEASAIYNEIIDAVIAKLKELFTSGEGEAAGSEALSGGSFFVYTDGAPQDFTKPCCYAAIARAEEKPASGRRCFVNAGVVVRYYSGDSQNAAKENNQALECLMEGLEYVVLSDGSLLRGTERTGRIADGILEFSVNYSLHIYRQKETKETMEDIEIRKGLVK